MPGSVANRPSNFPATALLPPRFSMPGMLNGTTATPVPLPAAIDAPHLVSGQAYSMRLWWRNFLQSPDNVVLFYPRVCFRGYGPSTNGKGYKRYRFPHDWRESAQKRENLCESDGTNFYHIKLPSDMNIEFPVWQKIVAFPNPTPDYYFRATFAPPI